MDLLETHNLCGWLVGWLIFGALTIIEGVSWEQLLSLFY